MKFLLHRNQLYARVAALSLPHALTARKRSVFGVRMKRSVLTRLRTQQAFLMASAGNGPRTRQGVVLLQVGILNLLVSSLCLNCTVFPSPLYM